MARMDCQDLSLSMNTVLFMAQTQQSCGRVPRELMSKAPRLINSGNILDGRHSEAKLKMTWNNRVTNPRAVRMAEDLLFVQGNHLLFIRNLLEIMTLSPLISFIGHRNL